MFHESEYLELIKIVTGYIKDAFTVPIYLEYNNIFHDKVP
jgi:hypothetical protein